ncbi:hypothetical protein LEP1GSC126_0073 [Leptospira kirschneri str. 200801774]|nr:hypothetical protein LEP1GSC126_0073 [Leptospira kirschneri str. 200801774]
MFIAKNSSGKFVGKFRDAKGRVCAVSEAESVGKEQTVWCGIECA